jgi:hypothetical protein
MPANDNDVLRTKGFVETSPGIFSRPTQTKSVPVPVLPHPKSELHARQESLDSHQDEAGGTGRTFVCIESRRVRPIDPDNLAGGCKFIIDALRYAGLLQEDTPEKISLQVDQKKVDRRTQEKTLIEITYP